MGQQTSQATEEAPYCKPYRPEPSRPVTLFPSGSCDTHAHICGPEASFPYDPARIYTPPDALLPAYEKLLSIIGVARMVLVQPSIYGQDNSVMLKAMAETSLPARGVAVVPLDIEDEELEVLHQAGIRGVRFNLVDVKKPAASVPLDKIILLAEKLRPLKWHVEFLLHVDDYPNFYSLFKDFPTEIVVAHFGYFRPGCQLENPGFQGLLELAVSGKCWVKLTGPYRISAEDIPYSDVDPFAQALVNRAPHRLLWGTDWPHVMMKKTMPDDGHLADTFGSYAAEEQLRHQILVDNPAQLYQF